MLRIQAEALTYDDVSLVPAHSTILPKDVTLTTRLTKGLSLRLPIVSAAMDTVSESRLAIALAQLGGISIIHKNMTVDAQAAQVARVPLPFQPPQAPTRQPHRLKVGTGPRAHQVAADLFAAQGAALRPKHRLGLDQRQAQHDGNGP